MGCGCNPTSPGPVPQGQKKKISHAKEHFFKFIFSIHLYVFGAAFFLPPDIGETENNGRGGCDSCAGKG